MPAIITSKFRFHNAEQFKESFSEAAATNYYLFIGRPGEFASGTTGGTDAAPPTPNDNRTQESQHWDDMLAAKRITSTGVAHAIPRRDLDTSGNTTYDMYKPNYATGNTATSGATNLFDSTFYFVTSAYRVYKVLDNNGGTNYAGGAEPTFEGDVPQAAGGYTLKYMYTLSTTDIQNFLTPDFMPVPTAAESGVALADGRLSIILITERGTALAGGSTWNITSDRSIVNVPIRGDGTGGLCTVVIGESDGPTNTAGKVKSISITSTNTGYTQASILPADIIEQHNIQFSEDLTFSGTQPAFEVIIPPDGGHGSNPAKELGGHFIMMDTKLQTTESFDFSVVNDFRQVGVVRNPYSNGTTSNFTNSTARQTFAIKLASNSGEFKVDGKIYQSHTAQTVSAVAVSGSTITLTTVTTPHQLAVGQMIDVSGGSFDGSNGTGHEGTHHITAVPSTTTFSYAVTSSRAPTGNHSGTTAYTTFQPQGTVVEWDSTNKILFYVQTSYDNQGTDATYKLRSPFSGNSQITGEAASGTATGTPDTSYSQTLNNTVFTSGYSNPEMQPNSGDIIYIENRKPISRASDQTEDIKLIVEF